jgi:hypothetical protein
MSVTTTEIARYSVSVTSDGDPGQRAATAYLYGATGNTIAFINFYLAGTTPPANMFRTDLGFPIINYPAATLPSVVDILRNEKPLFFTWFDYTTSRFGTIGTSREPVGETEPV